MSTFFSWIGSFKRAVMMIGVAGCLGACATGDAASDGTRTRSATQDGPSLSVRAFLRAYDTSGRGRITRAQYNRLRLQRFAAADTNGDGWLSENEFVAEYESRVRQRYREAGRAPDAAFQAQIAQARARFGTLDRDKDGRLSKTEALALADRFFREADINGDGVVDATDQALQDSRQSSNALKKTP